MATYVHNIMLDKEQLTGSSLEFRLVIEETPDIASNKSGIKARVESRNVSGGTVGDYPYHIIIKINGNTLVDKKSTAGSYLAGSAEWGTLSNWMEASGTYSHNASGGGSFTVHAEIEGEAQLMGGGYRNHGSVNITENYTVIDQSLPVVTSFIISADRYGLNAQTSFTVTHASYNITQVKFVLRGLTEAMCNARTKYTSQTAYDTATNDYSLVYTPVYPFRKPYSKTYNLDADTPSQAPLVSGKTYSYTLYVTAENGKETVQRGSFKVPQKVTGITCAPTMNLKQGESAMLDYAVIPSGAENQNVTFSSSSTAVVTVNTNGTVTAKVNAAVSIATAEVTVKTADGGYTATCKVTVTKDEPFPSMTAVTQYLTAEQFRNIASATVSLRIMLIDKGVSADSITLTSVNVTGKNHPVKSIKGDFESIEANCQALRRAAVSAGFSVSCLPSSAQTINKYNTDWITVVNNWINFLNALYNTLKGGMIKSKW